MNVKFWDLWNILLSRSVVAIQGFNRVVYGRNLPERHGSKRFCWPVDVTTLRKHCNEIEIENTKYVDEIVNMVANVLPESYLPELVATLLVGYDIPEHE